MNWEDNCYLLSKRKFRENANIINIFTEKKGKIDGIVYGGNSRKIRNYLQIGNKIFVLYTAKNNNRIGYFKTELVEAITPKYFNDKKRSSGILSISSIFKTIWLNHFRIHFFLYNLLRIQPQLDMVSTILLLKGYSPIL